MAAIHVRGEDGEWRPLPGVRSFLVEGVLRRIDFHIPANMPARVMVRNVDGHYAIVPDSDGVRVSLADDATWSHMRGLMPSPEQIEGT